MKGKPPTQGGAMTHSETPTQEMIMKGHGASSKSIPGDGGECEVRRLAGKAESLKHLQE